MLLAIDVGNTNIVLGLFEGSKLSHQFRVETRQHRTADEYAVVVHQLLSMRNVATAGVHAAIVRGLDRDPEYRFASMAELLDALNRGSGRARDPEFDLSVARPQRVMLSMIIPASR